MAELVAILVFAGCLLAVLGFFAWLASRIRRRGMARDVFQVISGAYDTMYRPTAQESHYEVQAQAERKVPVSSADVPWRRAGERGARMPPNVGQSRRRRSWWASRRRVR